MLQRSLAEKGNGLVEVILFTPLALLFLFIAIDAGLAYSERAAITNAVRSGLNVQTLAASNNGLLRFQDGEFVFDEAGANKLVQETAEAIGRNILRAQGDSAGGSTSHFRVQTHIVRLDIDEERGQLLGYQLVGDGEFPAGSSFGLASDAKQETLDAYLERMIGSERLREPTSFAAPLGKTFEALSSSSKSHYLPTSYVVVAEVSALTHGVAPKVTAKLFQGLYSYREHQLSLLRTQVS